MLPEPELGRALGRLPLVDLNGTFARAVALANLSGPPPGAPADSPPQPLWPGGARLGGQRLTPRGAFDCLYIADNGATALAEVGAIIDIPRLGLHGQTHAPIVVLSIELSLTAVLDLTNKSVRTALDTNLRELKRPWRLAQARFERGTGAQPATQILGSAAFRSGCITAVRYPSAKIGGAANLVVFTDHLTRDPTNVLSVHDPRGQLFQRLP